MRFAYSVSLPALPEQVFRWLTEEEKMKRWMNGLEEFRYIETKRGSLEGARFQQTLRTPFAPITWKGTVTAYKEAEKLELSLQASMLSLVIRYELQPSDGGTLLHETCRVEPNMWMSAMAPMIGTFCDQMFQTQMQQLKTCVESESR